MIARASGALLFSYFIIAIGGAVFLAFPSETLSQVQTYDASLVVWAMFYLVGGLFAAACIILRRFVKNTIPLWYFEIAGISLIVAANLVYAYAIATVALQFQEYTILAASFVVLAFAGGLVARSLETLRLVKMIQQYTKDKNTA